MALGLTYNELRTRVAEFLHVAYRGTDGKEEPQLPQNAHDLAIVSEIVNDAYRGFAMERDWEFLNPRASLTFVSKTTGTVETARNWDVYGYGEN